MGEIRINQGRAIQKIGKNEFKFIMLPFQGELWWCATLPRALPWAGIYWAFSPQNTLYAIVTEVKFMTVGQNLW